MIKKGFICLAATLLVLIVLVKVRSPELVSPAHGDDMPLDDGVPSGAVAFFNEGVTGCPPGWSPATYAAGRLLVGVNTGSEVGIQTGSPLGDHEIRLHDHGFAGTVELPSRSISGADGSNNNGAQSQTYTVNGISEPATSNLPFAQLFACEKQ